MVFLFVWSASGVGYVELVSRCEIPLEFPDCDVVSAGLIEVEIEGTVVVGFLERSLAIIDVDHMHRNTVEDQMPAEPQIVNCGCNTHGIGDVQHIDREQGGVV